MTMLTIQMSTTMTLPTLIIKTCQTIHTDTLFKRKSEKDTEKQLNYLYKNKNFKLHKTITL